MQKNVYGVFHMLVNRTAFEIIKGIGIDIELGRGIDAADLEKIIHRPWASDGLDFSDRIWNDLDKVNVRLHQELTRMAVTGDSPDEAIRRMAKEFETEKRNAARLVQTEHAAMSSAAQKDCFEDLDVEQYKYVATLDLKTSELCQEMDGRVFSMNQFKVGETAPPMHPRCRSTTAPYFADMDEFAERWSRDPETGERRMVPGNMTYKEWKAQQDKIHGEGSVDRKRKMRYNEKRDKERYEKYKLELGSNAPQSFDEFRNIKYGKDWNAFKAYAKAIKSGELTPLADFSLYKRIGNEIDEKLVGVVAANGIVITGKSWHFVARVIGSVEQKRNGVGLDAILRTIKSPDKIEEILRTSAGSRSQRLRKADVAVTINPDTGVLIQTNPLHKKRNRRKL